MPKDFFKLRVALFFGYNGKSFQGLQKNQDAHTVEKVIEEVLNSLGFISQENFGDQKKSGWRRASRTDKGVHAAVNGVNCKLNVKYSILEEGWTQDDIAQGKGEIKKYLNKQKILEDLNASFPEDIRIFSMKLTTNKFDIKMNAKSRVYEYILPIAAFHPIKPDGLQTINEEQKDHIFKKLTKVLKKFEGTHDYHNYTVEKKTEGQGTKRYLLSMGLERIPQQEVSELLGKEAKEDYFKITLHGQSFIYHQIRKMVGMTIQLFQENIDTFYLENSFCKNKIPIWLAPSEGLQLNYINFDAYNKRFDIPETLEFEESEWSQIEDFKRKVIYKEIISAQEDTKIFDQWLKTCIQFSESDFTPEINESKPEAQKIEVIEEKKSDHNSEIKEN